MKKFLVIWVALAVLSPSFAEEKSTDHSSSDKKAESTENKSNGRTEKAAESKGDLSKKLDACLKARPDSESKK